MHVANNISLTIYLEKYDFYVSHRNHPIDHYFEITMNLCHRILYIHISIATILFRYTLINVQNN